MLLQNLVTVSTFPSSNALSPSVVISSIPVAFPSFNVLIAFSTSSFSMFSPVVTSHSGISFLLSSYRFDIYSTHRFAISWWSKRSCPFLSLMHDVCAAFLLLFVKSLLFCTFLSICVFFQVLQYLDIAFVTIFL